jgi:hypothetical protein
MCNYMYVCVCVCVYIYIYIYIRVCVCVCVCVRERERENIRQRQRLGFLDKWQTDFSSERATQDDKDRNCQENDKNLVMSPSEGSTPTRTDWLAVSRNVTLTLTFEGKFFTFARDRTSVVNSVVRQYSLLAELPQLGYNIIKRIKQSHALYNWKQIYLLSL